MAGLGAAQPLPRTTGQLRRAKAALENAITTAVVDFSRRDEPQAAASTQFAIITEQMPLDRAAAEGWLVKLVRYPRSVALDRFRGSQKPHVVDRRPCCHQPRLVIRRKLS